MKRLVLVLSICVVVLFASVDTFAAGSIQSINLDVVLHKDGSATIRDTRTFTATSGSEHYISIGNLDNMSLMDYKVFDKNGKELEKNTNWNIQDSREQKRGKYGLISKDDGYEICFGYGDYGKHTFTIEYRISNFVFNLKDGNQAIYWKFLNKNMDSIERADVKIRNDINLKYEYPKSRLWGFGYKGQTKITENYLHAYTEEPMNGSNYMVVLSIFEGKKFGTTSTQSWTSDELINLALKGTKDEAKTKKPESRSSIYRKGIFRGFFIFVIAIILVRMSGKNKRIEEENYEEHVKQLDYYRQIPDEYFARTYYLSECNAATAVSAFILKWIFEKRLVPKDTTTGIIFKKDVISLEIVDESRIPNKAEEYLFEVVKYASGKDKVLTQKEFHKCIMHNYSYYSNFKSLLKNESKEYYKKIGACEEVKKSYLFFFTEKELVWNEKSDEIGDKITGFKKYLEDYSLVSEREAKEVFLWKDYLIWAAFFGIADKVYEQFKIVDPDAQITDVNLYDAIILSEGFEEETRSVSDYYSSSSGSGGSSYDSGGSGSFGGGDGGGSR